MIGSVRVSRKLVLSDVSAHTRYQLAFASRVKCYGQWQNAENEARRVKTNYEKAKKQSKAPERIHQEVAEVSS